MVKQYRRQIDRTLSRWSNRSASKAVVKKTSRQLRPNARDSSGRRLKRRGLRPAPKSVIMLYRGKNSPDFGVCNPPFQIRFQVMADEQTQGAGRRGSG
jgi:hypothetical protein